MVPPVCVTWLTTSDFSEKTPSVKASRASHLTGNLTASFFFLPEIGFGVNFFRETKVRYFDDKMGINPVENSDNKFAFNQYLLALYVVIS